MPPKGPRGDTGNRKFWPSLGGWNRIIYSLVEVENGCIGTRLGVHGEISPEPPPVQCVHLSGWSTAGD